MEDGRLIKGITDGMPIRNMVDGMGIIKDTLIDTGMIKDDIPNIIITTRGITESSEEIGIKIYTISGLLPVIIPKEMTGRQIDMNGDFKEMILLFVNSNVG